MARGPARRLVRQKTQVNVCLNLVYYGKRNWHLFQIADIKNSDSWYQQLKYWYQQSFADIRNSFAAINNWNSWYQEFEFFISTINIVDIKNYNYCNAALLISVIQFLDISNNNNNISNSKSISWYQECVHIVDINNSNSWYQQFQLLISRMCTHFWYQQFVFLISRNGNTDITNSNCWYQEFICWYQEFESLISLIRNKC